MKYPQGKRIYQEFHNIRKSYIDPDALKVIGRLQQFGYKAYIVGGCVRDLLLGRVPKDYDIVTNARPNEVRKIFANSRVIGKRFRIVHIIFRGNKIIEVSTARSLPPSRARANSEDDLYLTKDNLYGSFKDDAARRDFTINSLFLDVRNEAILDYTGGFEDLKAGMVRIIGDENISLPEDPVRMLRAIKFSALLGFTLHADLAKGIRRHRRLIQKSSVARLHEELNKIFRTGQTYEIIKHMVEHGLFEAMFPSIAAEANRLNPQWQSQFDQSLLGKSLSIADRMISEHEDINTNIYYAILAIEAVQGFLLLDDEEEVLQEKIHGKIDEFSGELGLTKKEQERLLQMYAAQGQFRAEVSERKGWVRNFKNKDYFLEAFIFYKIHSRASQNDEAIQKALFWEIGLRKKLPLSIRKVVQRPVSPIAESYETEKEEAPAPRREREGGRRRYSR